MRFSFPNWVKELIEQVNATGGEGVPGLLRHFPLVNRLGLLVDRDGFLADLNALVESHEAAVRESQSMAERLKSLKYPSLTGRNWKTELHTWMQTVYNVLHELEGSPKFEVPEPPDFNRAQRRLMAKFNLGLFFVPAWDEKQFPESWVKPNWTRFLQGTDIQHIELPGCWIAFEMIQKPNYQDGVYPDDRLIQAISLDSRFNHPHSGKGESDDLVKDILPKAAAILAPLGGTTKVQWAEVFNFMGNLFNWATKHTADSFPDLGATNSVEWCENRYGSRDALIVGNSDRGGLACVGGS